MTPHQSIASPPSGQKLGVGVHGFAVPGPTELSLGLVPCCAVGSDLPREAGGANCSHCFVSPTRTKEGTARPEGGVVCMEPGGGRGYNTFALKNGFNPPSLLK